VAEPAAVASPIEAPAPHSAVREFAFTLILVFIILSATRQDMGFLLLLLTPFLLLWFLRLPGIARREPARRKVQAIKLACVAATVALAVFIQINIQRQARERAQHVVDVVAAYRAQHGSYPDNLAQAGLDEKALRRWRVQYAGGKGGHLVAYPGGFMVFDVYSYDFDMPGWNYSLD